VERSEHSEKRSSAVKPVMHHRERDDLRQADPRSAEHDGGQDRAQHRSREEVIEAGGELGATQAAALRARDVGRAHEREGSGGEHERDCVQHRDEPAAREHVEAGACHRRSDADARARALEHAVGLRQQLVGQHSGDQPAARCGADLLREAVCEGYRVDDPDIAAVVDEQQRQDDDGGRQVVADQHMTAREAIRDHACQRCQEPREREEAEGDPARARGAGQLERPDAEHHEERAVPEEARHMACEEQAEVAVACESLHRAHRRIQTCGITCCANIS
jgi:hypothetical protein